MAIPTRFSVSLAAVLLTLAVTPGVTLADVVGAGPDESPAQAYGPLVLNTPVAGTFVNQSDVDLLAFKIAAAGETLYFTLANTTTNCPDPNDAGCPVYATLMDQTGVNQIGGPTSDAGTIATAQDTETFSWTFPSAGTYYVELESNGDLPAGTPTYRFMVSDSPYALIGSSGTGGTTGSPPPASTGAPLIESLHVATRQRGGRIRMLLRTGMRAGGQNDAHPGRLPLHRRVEIAVRRFGRPASDRVGAAGTAAPPVARRPSTEARAHGHGFPVVRDQGDAHPADHRDRLSRDLNRGPHRRES
jgi:hypothetical protein